MKNNTKYIVVLTLFIAFIGGFFFLNLFMEDEKISYAERRPLEQLPELTIESVLNTDFMEDFEKYTLDQFVFRDSFRKIKAYTLFNVFGQKDNNGIYEYNGNISKIKYPLNEQSIINATNKFNTIMQTHFPNNNVYYSVIPDKNFFMATELGYLDIDYNKLVSLMDENIEGMEYINIFGELNLNSYYNTDIHWKQEEIRDVAIKLATEMGFLQAIEGLTYEKTEMSGFHGVYSGQYALEVGADVLTYLTNGLMDNWTVKVINTKGAMVDGKFPFVETTIYNEGKFVGTDPYDVYLNGAVPFIEITNANNQSGKELFLFRDSFSSSLAPLLVEGYSKVTLIDIRYIDTNTVSNYVDFGEGNDVLFLYCTEVLNNSAMLRG